MSTMPPSIALLNKAMGTLQLTPQKVKALGITRIEMVSIRTVRMDIPAIKEGPHEGANRVKVTAREDGTLDVRLEQVIERDVIGGVLADNLGACLKLNTGLDFGSAA